MVRWYRPCGTGLRPYILTTQARIGRVFRAVYHIFSLPREDGLYSTPGAWVVVSASPPRNYEEPAYVFPNGCPLLWSIGKPWVLVWSFGGIIGYDGALMHREPNGRTVVLQLAIPNDRAFVGKRIYTQLITAESGPEVKMSQLLEITIGD